MSENEIVNDNQPIEGQDLGLKGADAPQKSGRCGCGGHGRRHGHGGCRGQGAHGGQEHGGGGCGCGGQGKRRGTDDVNRPDSQTDGGTTG